MLGVYSRATHRWYTKPACPSKALLLALRFTMWVIPRSVTAFRSCHGESHTALEYPVP